MIFEITVSRIFLISVAILSYIIGVRSMLRRDSLGAQLLEVLASEGLAGPVYPVMSRFYERLDSYCLTVINENSLTKKYADLVESSLHLTIIDSASGWAWMVSVSLLVLGG